MEAVDLDVVCSSFVGTYLVEGEERQRHRMARSRTNLKMVVVKDKHEVRRVRNRAV